jgi:hypothetical protein
LASWYRGGLEDDHAIGLVGSADRQLRAQVTRRLQHGERGDEKDDKKREMACGHVTNGVGSDPVLR